MNRYKSIINVVIALLLVFGLLGAFPTRQQVSAFATDLIISEYIEGFGDNDDKAIEIYNGTDHEINLGSYKLYKHNSGTTTGGFETLPSLTLPNGATFQIIHLGSTNSKLIAKISSPFFGMASLICNFDGNDTLVLSKTIAGVDVVVDSFGQKGFNPGLFWEKDGVQTQDRTLVRKPNICSGDTNPFDSFDPSAQWSSFPQNTFTYFGAHTANCDTPTVSNVTSNDPANNATNVLVNTNIVINFDIPVTVNSGWFTISCANSGSHTAVVTGTSPSATYTLNPNVNFVYGEQCTVTIVYTNVTPAMTDNHIFSFSTEPPVNHTPVARAQGVETTEDIPLDVILTGTDADGDELTFQDVTPPTNGTLSGTAPNLTYTPNTNWFGTDSFTFIANDGTVDSEPATITIAVTAVNDPPVLASIGAKTVNKDTLLTFNAAATDVDLPAQELSFSLAGTVPGGAAITSSGVFSWTPTSLGAFTFTIKVCDVASECDTEEVTITVLSDTTSIDLTAIADSYTTVKDTVLIVTLETGVLSNDIDGYIGLLIALLDVTAANGELVLAADGSFTYMPGFGFIGEDSFTYKAFDGLSESNLVTVTITVSEKKPVYVTFYLPLILR